MTAVLLSAPPVILSAPPVILSARRSSARRAKDLAAGESQILRTEGKTAGPQDDKRQRKTAGPQDDGLGH